ncbi:hypothetical protein ACH5RR_036234 [Cinchona calisaya]|uniref:C3H1-type domain-containing protein n=1 Tax=Cinchona calisaya TaxID=153742 RepID=A0ABD2Y4L2_9GENT
MEKEIPKLGQRCGRTSRNDVSFNNIPSSSSSPPLPFFDYSGDLGFAGYRPSDREMMMMSRLRHSDLLNELHHHQDLMDSQHALLSYMEETTKETRALREENVSLKMVNAELTDRLSSLLRATSDHAASVGYSGLGPGPGPDINSVLDGLRRMSLAGGDWGDDEEADEESPNPNNETVSGPGDESDNAVEDRVSLPKSISVRSNGYLKTVQTGESSGGQVNKQRVYVLGGEKEKQPVELDVYNQGMFKTELCNKWQQTGACPYGENCQFAHGIKDLRPILRHPRYKTEACRMVLNGDHCPYGHRCHFRHTLTDEENHIRSLNQRPLQPLNR